MAGLEKQCTWPDSSSGSGFMESINGGIDEVLTSESMILFIPDMWTFFPPEVF